MAENYYGVEEEEEASPKGRDNLFIWTVFILLLIGVAFACWLGSFYIFSHPEHPRAYKVLKKLGKIEAPRRFEDIAAPPGEFLSAQKLFERYSKFSRLELERENADLLRNYINNYRETKKLVPYVRGKFDILDSYDLQKSDVFGSGVVALAQSIDFPQVVIEHVFTAPPANVPAIRGTLQTGYQFPLERTKDLSAVIHVEKVYEGRLQLTVVPLLYGSYGLTGAAGSFSLEPPADYNIDGALPIVNKQTLQEGLKRFADFRRRSPVVAAAESPVATPQPSGPELVRVDAVPEGAKAPLTGPLPEMPVATPIPARPLAAKPISARPLAATPPPALALNTTPRPAATPLGEAPPTATPIARSSPQGVPLTPFIASNPSSLNRRAPGESWRTFAAGQLPRGRTVTAAEASELANRGFPAERIYLRGRFVVTAAGENRAVLRPQGGADGGGVLPAGTRVLVEFPSGTVAPAEGAVVARDESRPFEVQYVERSGDGTINIRAREITRD